MTFRETINMKSLIQFIKEARRSKIRPDAKHGDEEGVTDKSNNIATVNITDEKNDELDTKGPDAHTGPRKRTLKAASAPLKAFKEASEKLDTKGPDGKVGPRKRTINTVKSVMKAYKEDINEARAGRPKKNATEDDPGSEHIMMQMRKVISLRGQHKVTHVSGEKSDVSPTQAHKAIAHHDNLKTSAEKDTYAKRLHRSASSMHDALSGKEEKAKPKVSLAGKITGTQSEGFLDVTPKTGKMTHVTINKTARSKSTNAPASSGPSQTAATNRSADLQQNAEAESKAKKDAASHEIAKRKTAEKIRKSVAPKAPEAPQAKQMGA